METILKTFIAVAGLSLVIPLYFLIAVGDLRSGLHAWWIWWKIMLIAFAVVGGFALISATIERF